MKAETVTVETVRDALTMLNLRSGRGLSSDNISLLAMEFTEDFEDEDVTPAEFERAYRRVRREANGYIPNSGRFLELIREERSDGSDQQLSPEEIDRNMRRFQALTAWCRGELSADGVEQAFSAIAREQDPRKADCAEKAIEAPKIAKTAQRDSGYRVADNLRF